VKNFGLIRNNWFFGVCDGHGINGHYASDHVKKFLPQNIEYIDNMAIKNRSGSMSKVKTAKNKVQVIGSRG